MTVTSEDQGSTEQLVLEPGRALINPAGVWHAVDAHGTARILTITPGLGTEHRQR